MHSLCPVHSTIKSERILSYEIAHWTWDLGFFDLIIIPLLRIIIESILHTLSFLYCIFFIRKLHGIAIGSVLKFVVEVCSEVLPRHSNESECLRFHSRLGNS